MEKQVSTLYPLDGSMDKRKTLEITKVMKGALSVSKSRTGEAIYRSNEFHKKILEKKVKQFKSATETEISSYNSKKRTVTQRFSVMFGKHKATNDTMHAYDEVITKALEETSEKQPNPCLKPIIIDSECEDEDPETENCPKDQGLSNGGKDVVRLPHVSDSNGKVREVRKSIDEPQKKSVFIPTGILLPINNKFSRLKFHEEQREEEPEVEVEETKELWPLENTEKYDKYIRKQKDRHEVLVTRNILKKIKKNITGKDTLLKFQMKAYLSDDPEEFVRNLTSAKTAPPDTAVSTNTNKQFKKYISKLPSQTPRRTAPSYGSLQSARLFPPLPSGSVKSTGRLLPLKRSKTMPV